MSRILCQGASCPRGIYPGHACVSGNLQDATKVAQIGENRGTTPPRGKRLCLCLLSVYRCQPEAPSVVGFIRRRIDKKHRTRKHDSRVQVLRERERHVLHLTVL